MDLGKLQPGRSSCSLHQIGRRNVEFDRNGKRDLVRHLVMKNEMAMRSRGAAISHAPGAIATTEGGARASELLVKP